MAHIVVFGSVSEIKLKSVIVLLRLIRYQILLLNFVTEKMPIIINVEMTSAIRRFLWTSFDSIVALTDGETRKTQFLMERLLSPLRDLGEEKGTLMKVVLTSWTLSRSRGMHFCSL